jgi:hypothetical protein
MLNFHEVWQTILKNLPAIFIMIATIIQSQVNENSNSRLKNFAKFFMILAAISTCYNACDSDKKLETISSLTPKIDSATRKLSRNVDSLNDVVISLQRKSNSLDSASYTLEQEIKSIATYTSNISKEAKEINSSALNISKQTNSFVKSESLKNTKTGILKFELNNLKPKDSLTLSLGGVNCRYEVKEFQIDPNIGKRCVNSPNQTFSIEIINGEIYLTANVINEKKEVMVEIIKNGWRVNEKTLYKFNYDSKGIEVVDDKDIVRLSIKLLPQNTILIQGLFFLSGDQYFVASENETLFYISLNDKEARSVKKQFEYTGENYIGKRVQ